MSSAAIMARCSQETPGRVRASVWADLRKFPMRAGGRADLSTDLGSDRDSWDLLARTTKRPDRRYGSDLRATYYGVVPVGVATSPCLVPVASPVLMAGRGCELR